MAKKRTKTYKEKYLQQLKTIQRNIKKASAQGYIIDDVRINRLKSISRDVKAEQLVPKSVNRKQYEQLHKINLTVIKKHALWVDSETGEVKTGAEHLKEKRSEAARKGWEKRRKKGIPDFSTIGDVRGILKKIERTPEIQNRYYIPYEERKSAVLKIFEEAVMNAEDEGKIYDYSVYLRDNVDIIKSACEEIGYESKDFQVDRSFRGLAEMLKKDSLSPWEQEAISEDQEFYNG